MNRGWIVEQVRDYVEVHGVPSRMACPSCHGGSDSEECMSIYESSDGGAVLATCHRAHCDVGTVSLTKGIFKPAYEKKREPSHAYKDWSYEAGKQLGLPRPEMRELWWYRMWTGAEHVPDMDHQYVRRIRMASTHTYWKVLYAMRDHIGTLQGIVERCIGTGAPFKARTHKLPDWNGMGFFPTPEGRDTDAPLLIVEDPSSAYRAANWGGVYSCSLNGTAMGDLRFAYISARWKSVIIALDADATHLAIEYLRRYSGIMQSVSVLRLDKDIKDMTKPVVKSLLSKYT